jgi:hypothetical protein
MQTRKDTEQTNEQFAATNERFKTACILENVPQTRRQASKWRRKTGRAYLNLGKHKQNLASDERSLIRDLAILSSAGYPSLGKDGEPITPEELEQEKEQRQSDLASIQRKIDHIRQILWRIS